jgi:peptidoglycan-associated lipoprotein
MLARVITVGVVALGGAGSAMAQQRGTVEFGAFASNTAFDNGLGMNSGWGAGGRVGVFVVPRLSVEFEAGGSSAGRASGLQNVNVGTLSARLTAVPLKFGRVSVLLGGGFEHTDAYFVESYGVHGLLGAKVAFSEVVALRIDGIGSYMANGKYTNLGLHLGLSIYRNPPAGTNPVSRVAAPVAQRPDSVSASETRRLRAVAGSYQALRDSLARRDHPAYVPESSATARTTMQQMIYFQNGRSDLSESAKAILNDKVRIFRNNPKVRIGIVGFASGPRWAAYNMALGLRRAGAAKAYLVSQGIAPVRIEIATRGAEELVIEGPVEVADAANRRGQFRLLIADPPVGAPTK